MIGLMSFRTVFFDLDGTLSDYTSVVNRTLGLISDYANKQNPAVEQSHFIKAYWKLVEEMENLQRQGTIEQNLLLDREYRFAKTLELIGAPSSKLAKKLADIYSQQRSGSPILFDGVKETLQWLRGRASLGVISQGSEDKQVRQLENLGILDFFDHLVMTGKVKLYKPDDRLYLEAARIANSKPQECIMVGDRLDWDIAPAKRVGMMTILFTENSLYYNEFLDDLDAADHIAEDYDQVLEILKETLRG